MTLKECYDFMGGDYNDAVARLINDENVARFLKKFLDNKDFEKMEEAILEKNYQEVFSTSHNLKGMAANLSLTKLTRSCSDICEQVRHGEPKVDLQSLLETAKSDYIKVVEVISELD